MELSERMVNSIKRDSQGGYIKKYGPNKIADFIVYEFWIRRDGEYDTCYVLKDKNGSERKLENFDSLCVIIQEMYSKKSTDSIIIYVACFLIVFLSIILGSLLVFGSKNLNYSIVLSIFGSIIATIMAFLFKKFIPFGASKN